MFGGPLSVMQTWYRDSDLTRGITPLGGAWSIVVPILVVLPIRRECRSSPTHIPIAEDVFRQMHQSNNTVFPTRTHGYRSVIARNARRCWTMEVDLCSDSWAHLMLQAFHTYDAGRARTGLERHFDMRRCTMSSKPPCSWLNDVDSSYSTLAR
jgi:hypothetical protein